MGRPGEVLGGALAERLTRMWRIIVQNVGDDPLLDPHQVYAQTWQGLLRRYSVQVDLAIEGDRWMAMYLQNPAQMEAVVDACISHDEL